MKHFVKVFIFAAVLCTTITALRCVKQSDKVSAAETVGNYVALGDSIAAGYGLSNASTEGYVAQISSMLKVSNTLNLGITGLNSTQLLDALKTKELQTAISNASVITLSIGSNDILGPFTTYVAQAFGITDIAQIGNVLKDSNPITVLLQIASLTKLINEDATCSYGMKAGAMKFAANFPAIIASLKSCAPCAEIYVNNLYNPYRGITIATLNLGGITEAYITEINNTVFSSTSTDYNLVNVYSVFNTTDNLVNADLSTNNFDPHPNVSGHTAIANSYLGVLGAKSNNLKSMAEIIQQIDMSKLNSLMNGNNTVSPSGDNASAIDNNKLSVIPNAIIKSAVMIKSSNKAKITLKKLKNTSGYQLKFSPNKTFKKALKSQCSKKAIATIRNLKKNTTYYVKARSFIVANGKKIYGKWSKIKKIREK